MGQISLVVDYQIKPGQRDNFVKRVRQHGRTCLDREPGCLRFDVLVPREDGDRVLLYETYSDQAAFDAHAATAYMAEYRRDIQDIMLERKLAICDLVSA